MRSCIHVFMHPSTRSSSSQTLMPDGVDVTKMLFMTGMDTTVAGIEGCRVTRCGYIGEDGYEVRARADLFFFCCFLL